MANELLNSPAEIVAQLLVDLGVGSNPDAVSAQAWPVHVDEFNDAIDQQIAVQDTLGSPDGRAQVNGSLFCHFGFQVMVRAKHPRDGWRKADEVRQALATVDGGTGTNAWAGNLVIVVDADGSAHAYSVLSVNQISPVIRNGREPTSARRRWSVNATATIESYAFPAAAAYYPLDGDGTDASGNGKDLAPGNGGSTYGDGRFGQSLWLDASGVNRRNDLLSGRITGTDYTVSAWVYRTGSSAQGLIGFAGNGNEAILVLANSEVSFEFIDQTYATSQIAVSADSWHHVTIVVHENETADFYVDGTWRETLTGMTDATAFDPASSFYVSSGAQCRIDDVAVVPAALNSTEVAALWDGGRGRPYPV